MQKNKKIKIGVYGLAGSYTHQAAINFIKKNKIKNTEFVFMEFFSEVFSFSKKSDLIVFPIENSNGGTVTQTLDILPQAKIEIISQDYFKIDHALLAHKDAELKQIKNVYSHPQALAQCSKFLNQNKLKDISFSDTSAAAKYVSKLKKTDCAAIGSLLLADIYDLKIIKKDFQNSDKNFTRFLMAKKDSKTKFEFETKLKKSKKTSIIFELKDFPSALYKCLGSFATNKINLTKIESRPLKNKNFHYFFFLEFEGSIQDPNVISALKELKLFAKKIKILGSY